MIVKMKFGKSGLDGVFCKELNTEGLFQWNN